MSNCIWKVDKEDRHCEYCTYRGGCEKHALYVEPENEACRYVRMLSAIVGRNVLERSRRPVFVWARNMISYQMVKDGYGVTDIGRCLGLHHSTIIYAVGQVREMLKIPTMYREETRIWERFQEMLSLEKNDMNYEKNLDENQDLVAV